MMYKGQTVCIVLCKQTNKLMSHPRTCLGAMKPTRFVFVLLLYSRYSLKWIKEVAHDACIMTTKKKLQGTPRESHHLSKLPCYNMIIVSWSSNDCPVSKGLDLSLSMEIYSSLFFRPTIQDIESNMQGLESVHALTA